MALSYTIIIISCLLILIVWWLYGREKIGYEHINPLLKKYSFVPYEIRLLWGIRIIIFLLIGILWVDPHMKKWSLVDISERRNIIFALDISKSMRADDISPSRLDKAKEVLIEFLSKEDSISIGLTVFAGRAFVYSPPTQDRDSLRSMISRIDTDTIDQTQIGTSGSNVGDALIASIEAGEKSGTGKNIIILLTDGRANTGISPLIAANLAKEKNITIYTVGIGGSSGSTLSYIENGIRKYFYDTSGNKIFADIDENTLREISSRTGGRYFYAGDKKLLEDIFYELQKILHTEAQYKQIERHLPISDSIVLCIVFLMVLHLILSKIIRRKYKHL